MADKRMRLIQRVRELAREIGKLSGTTPDYRFVEKRRTSEEQIIEYGKRLRFWRDSLCLHQQIADMGYNVPADDTWMAHADLDELRVYVEVQQEYLDWCQQHRVAVERLRAAWAAEFATGRQTPTKELETDTYPMTPEEIDALATRVEQRVQAPVFVKPTITRRSPSTIKF